ncbi:MAG: response regulator [Planctomycetota bacterium]
MSGCTARQLPIDQLPHGICVINAEGRVVLWSQILEDWLGVPPQKAEGRLVEELPSIIDHAAWRDWCDNIMNDAVSVLRSMFPTDQLLTQTPANCPAHLTASAHPYRHQGVPGVMLVFEDRLADSDIQAMQDELERESQRLKADFLALVSHELRTPLNGIMGMAVLLQLTKLDEQQADYVKTLNVSGEAMLSVVTELLDFSTVMRKGLTSENVHFRPISLVESTASTWASWAFDKGLSFIIDCDPTLPAWAIGSPEKLRHALSSIVNNAVKFTDQGVVCVRAHCRQGPDAPAATHEIEVQDSGIGIDSQQLSHVSDAFSQAEPTLTRRHSGLGLGLSTSHELIARIGGRLHLDSTPGKGTTIRISVPMTPTTAPEQEDTCDTPLPPDLSVTITGASAAATNLEKCLRGWGIDIAVGDAAQPAAAVTIREVPSPSGHGPTAFEIVSTHDTAASTVVLEQPLRRDALRDAVARAATPLLEATPPTADSGQLRALLVEDSPINQRVVTRLLERTGCEVSVASNGAEGVTLASRQDFDIIFMDCQMPVLDGYAATRQIRLSEQAGEHVPIVALTVQALPEDVEECLACGMDSHIPKPATEEALSAAIAAIGPMTARA